MKSKSFMTQLVIVGGFLVFAYVFFALATAVYKDYKLDVNITKFEDEIKDLAETAREKPKGVAFYQSPEYKDRYAKENLNLLNPGERLIIIPQEDQVVKTEEIVIDETDTAAILALPNRQQWWEYFFGPTLSLKTPKGKAAEPASGQPDAEPKEG